MTLNQIKKKLNDLADAHLQIKSFGWGDSWEFEADGGVNASTMWVIPRGFNIEAKAITYNFNILFMDLVDKDEANETEVLSDQTLICMDILSQLDEESESDDFTIVKNNSAEFFTERFDNEWSGVYIDLGIRVNYLRNNCNIPNE